MILNFEENLMVEELPEPWKYILSWEIERHMDRVQAKRKDPNKEDDTDYDSPEFERGEIPEAFRK